MLSLQMKSGDYLTIGEDVIVQVFKDSNAKFRVSITAPKEIPILRGAVREREGGARPDGLRKGVLPSPSSRRYAARRMEQYMQKLEERHHANEIRAEAVARLRSILDTAELPSDLRLALNEQVERIELVEDILGKGGAEDGAQDRRETASEYGHQGAPRSNPRTG